MSIGFVAAVGITADYDQLKQLAAGALAEAKGGFQQALLIRATIGQPRFMAA